jgi:hypothetical protein
VLSESSNDSRPNIADSISITTDLLDFNQNSFAVKFMVSDTSIEVHHSFVIHLDL